MRLLTNITGPASPSRIAIRRTLALAFLCALGCAASPAHAAAEEATHLFDATLSLTGDCKTSAIDPVPDPGLCPIPPGVRFAPGETEADHPSAAFQEPKDVTTDSHGDIYVLNDELNETTHQIKGRIDVFDATGHFLTELQLSAAISTLAVDSKGNLYVLEDLDSLTDRNQVLLRFAPTQYEPLSGSIDYSGAPVTVEKNGKLERSGPLRIDQKNDHLFSKRGSMVAEYGSAEEGNPLLDTTLGAGTLREAAGGLAVDAAHGRVYAAGVTESSGKRRNTIWIFERKSPHQILGDCDGATVPDGAWGGEVAVAVDEGSGHLFVYDSGANKVFELTGECEYVSTIAHSFQSSSLGSQLQLDNSPASPNRGHLFVPSPTNGHVFAFAPKDECPPEVESITFTGVTENEAQLRAQVIPCVPEAHYVFQYTTQARYSEEGFAGALTAAEGQLAQGTAAVPISTWLDGLSPGTAYRFRVVVENQCEPGGCVDEAAASFATYLPAKPSSACPNESLRTALSAPLPDCRAYELVSPSDTNGHTLFSPTTSLGVFFSTREASPAGDRVSFLTESGPIPGAEGNGSFAGDPYLATRGADGWSTAAAGPDGIEAPGPQVGSTSADQGYSFWISNKEGPASLEGKNTAYVRYPDGHSALLGRGSIANDPGATGRFISENGLHIVFVSGNTGSPAVQLEDNSPPSGTKAIYDRTADEVTHVISLLPGDATPAAGQNASLLGFSPDGRGVAFRLGDAASLPIYLRYENAETYEVAPEGEFAGIAEGGARTFYVRGGDLFAYDALQGETIRFSEAGDVTVVNVASGGEAAYFVSPSVLTGQGQPNPRGELPVPGGQNLYLSREGAISFVATVTDRDVEGEMGETQTADGLGLWISALRDNGRFGRDPSRTTPEGGTLLFRSRADIAGYDPAGHPEIYRFDLAAGALDCLSCNPTLAPAEGEASLQSESQVKPPSGPLSSFAFVPNLSPDGHRALFQSTEALVPGDVDGLQDVYEWEDQGVGSCDRPGGCVFLISSGRSARPNYLYAAGEWGNDVFIITPDLLLPALDPDGTPSIYDARVNGGFPERAGPAGECLGEACQPAAVAPSDPTPASSSFEGKGNVREEGEAKSRCPKGKRKSSKAGKSRCVAPHKQHNKKQHNKRAKTDRRAHR